VIVAVVRKMVTALNVMVRDESLTIFPVKASSAFYCFLNHAYTCRAIVVN
jgi:hypothetical protein